MPFNGSSASGDVTGEVVYANYGRLEDFDQLAAQHIDLHGKIVIARYGSNFRGVKVYLAEQRGAAGVLIYSDPQDDGTSRAMPIRTPWRPETGVQRGSVQFLFKYPATLRRPASHQRLTCRIRRASIPKAISRTSCRFPSAITTHRPYCSAQRTWCAAGWQGALPFRYHLGPGGVKVHLVRSRITSAA